MGEREGWKEGRVGKGGERDSFFENFNEKIIYHNLFTSIKSKLGFTLQVAKTLTILMKFMMAKPAISLITLMFSLILKTGHVPVWICVCSQRLPNIKFVSSPLSFPPSSFLTPFPSPPTFFSSPLSQEEITVVGETGKIEAFAPAHGHKSDDPNFINLRIGRRSGFVTSERPPDVEKMVPLEEHHIGVDESLLQAGCHEVFFFF